MFKPSTAKRNPRSLFVYGGIAAAFILVAFGIAAIVVGYQGREDVRNTLAQENIVGPEDSAIPGQLVDTGSEARSMADVMREHTLARTDGLTYAEMGRFMAPGGDPAGTNDASLAVLDEDGNPVANPLRDLWVTETALSTSLNTAYFAEQVALFSMVMGAALLLTGIGFVVLTIGALRSHLREADEEAEAPARGVAAAQAR